MNCIVNRKLQTSKKVRRLRVTGLIVFLEGQEVFYHTK